MRCKAYCKHAVICSIVSRISSTRCLVKSDVSKRPRSKKTYLAFRASLSDFSSRRIVTRLLENSSISSMEVSLSITDSFSAASAASAAASATLAILLTELSAVREALRCDGSSDSLRVLKVKISFYIVSLASVSTCFAFFSNMFAFPASISSSLRI